MPRRIRFLGPGDEFPPTGEALDSPNGLLAAGGDLTPNRLLAAYRRGIFPWYEEPQPILWWTPNPRAVLFPDELHVARSLRKELRKMSPGVKIETDEIRAVLSGEVIKRDALEGEKAEEAKKKITAYYKKAEKAKAKVAPVATAVVDGEPGQAVVV